MTDIDYAALNEIELAQHANGGDATARYHLARRVEGSITHDMHPDEVVQRRSRANQNFRDAARGGSVEAAVHMANHLVGNGQIDLAASVALQFLRLYPDRGLAEFAEVLSRPNMSKSGLARLILSTAARALTTEARAAARAAALPMVNDAITPPTPPLAPGRSPG
jgi:hypothetical protein